MFGGGRRGGGSLSAFSGSADEPIDIGSSEDEHEEDKLLGRSDGDPIVVVTSEDEDDEPPAPGPSVLRLRAVHGVHRIVLLALEAKTQQPGLYRWMDAQLCIRVDYSANRNGGGGDAERLVWTLGHTAAMCSDTAELLGDCVPISNIISDGLSACVSLARRVVPEGYVIAVARTGSCIAELVRRTHSFGDEKTIADIAARAGQDTWESLRADAVRVFSLDDGPTVLCVPSHISYMYNLLMLTLRALVTGALTVPRGSFRDVTSSTDAVARLAAADERDGRRICPGCFRRFHNSSQLQAHKNSCCPELIHRR
jgi:hypothetical protein